MDKKTRKRPRDGAGQFDLTGLGGTGPITTMVSLGAFMEIYMKDATFSVKTPDGVDPDQLHDDAPWEIRKVSNIGSAHPAIARILVQGTELLKSCMSPEIREPIDHLLWQCKEEVLVCERLAGHVVEKIEVAMSADASTRVFLNKSRQGMIPPSVPNLVSDCDELLVHVKRALRLVSQIAAQVVGITAVCQNFDVLARELEKRGSATGLLWDVVQQQKETIKRFIDMRNAREHPKEGHTCEICDFTVLPNRKIRVPTWNIAGQEAIEIRTELQALPMWLVDLAEHTVLGAVLMHPSPFPFIPYQLAPDQINPDCPMRFSLSLDMDKMNCSTEQSRPANDVPLE